MATRYHPVNDPSAKEIRGALSELLESVGLIKEAQEVKTEEDTIKLMFYARRVLEEVKKIGLEPWKIKKLEQSFRVLGLII